MIFLYLLITNYILNIFVRNKKKIEPYKVKTEQFK